MQNPGDHDYNLQVSSSFHFEQRITFDAENAVELLREVPTLPGVFALRGERASDQPYLTQAADLRRRMVRLLAPPESQSKRLNLRDKVRSIEYTTTGSAFESSLVLYDATSSIFGHVEARRRLRLNTPFFLRLTMERAHPRVYSTNRLSQSGLAHTYGPFSSRATAERYCDAVLDLFKLRRCFEDLDVHPDHPGCVYGEMKKCMAPCNASCTAEEYAAEARAVQLFFDTHGESMLGEIMLERERASAEMEFERAAELHLQHQRVKAAAVLADELVRPLLKLRAVIVQAAARRGGDANEGSEAAVFLLEGGCLLGPERLSTLGVRAVKEQTSVGSSLFAQPLMLQAVPLEGDSVTEMAPAASTFHSPELRAEGVLGRLTSKAKSDNDLAGVSDHLSLLRRWYYRPEKQRAGEIFFPNSDGSWPIRRILRGAARIALGEPKAMAETQRDLVAAAENRILHEGREGIERVVPVAKGAGRGRKTRAKDSSPQTPESPQLPAPRATD